MNSAAKFPSWQLLTKLITYRPIDYAILIGQTLIFYAVELVPGFGSQRIFNDEAHHQATLGLVPNARRRAGRCALDALRCAAMVSMVSTLRAWSSAKCWRPSMASEVHSRSRVCSLNAICTLCSLRSERAALAVLALSTDDSAETGSSSVADSIAGRNGDVFDVWRGSKGLIAWRRIADKRSRVVGNSLDAVSAVRSIDVPRYAGSKVASISPTYISAKAFSAGLAKVLQGEGFTVSTTDSSAGAIKVVTVEPINAVVVFAQNDKLMTRALYWSEKLDKPGDTGTDKKTFVYKVKILQLKISSLSSAACNPRAAVPQRLARRQAGELRRRTDLACRRLRRLPALAAPQPAPRCPWPTVMVLPIF